MYTIGQFSKICHVTIKALRHYEKLGLLSPAAVDRENGYRYYSREQVETVKTIARMKDLGVPLKKVKLMLERGAAPEMVKSILEEHRDVLHQELHVGNSRLSKLSWWLNELEANERMEIQTYDIRLREVPEMMVRAVRKNLQKFPEEVPPMLITLLREIEDNGGICAGAPILLYYDEEFKPDNVDLEVAWPVNDRKLSNRILPAIKAAACTYVGPYEGLENVYAALYAWINENGYRAQAPMREINLNDPRNTPREQLVTEVLIPVVKA
jgi:DNA-binding transcriptional MerR regulator/predicted transcriptional regulator YdeE